MNSNEEQINQLAGLILEERLKKRSEDRYRKGIALSSLILMPGAAKLYKGAHVDSDWRESKTTLN